MCVRITLVRYIRRVYVDGWMRRGVTYITVLHIDPVFHFLTHTIRPFDSTTHRHLHFLAAAVICEPVDLA